MSSALSTDDRNRLLTALRHPLEYLGHRSFVQFRSDQMLRDAVIFRMWIAQEALRSSARRDPLTLARVPIPILCTLRYLPSAPHIPSASKLWWVMREVLPPLISALKRNAR